MPVIDRYLLWQFLMNFVICFCSLTGLYVVFDAFNNLDEFVAFAEKGGRLLAIMAEYYAYRSVFFFDLTSGMLALTAAMFTVTWIQRHNELAALMAAGISKTRVIVPVIAAAVAITLLAAASRETFMPAMREQLSRTPQDLSGEAAQDLRPRYDNQTDILIRGQKSFANEQRIEGPSFLLPRALDDYGKQLSAENAFYLPPDGARPGGYLLRKVQQPKGIASRPSLPAAGTKIVITSQDAKWLKADECFVTSDVSFEQLTGGRGWRQFASTPALVGGLRNRSLDLGADVRVSIHARLVRPIMDITLLFLGLPLILTRDNRNVFISVGLCMLVVSVFLLVNYGSQYLGNIYLIEPALAAWLPLMIFVPIAVGMCDPLLE